MSEKFNSMNNPCIVKRELSGNLNDTTAAWESQGSKHRLLAAYREA